MPYVEVDGAKVHYVEAGPAADDAVATAVLVHGFPVDHRLMTGAFEPVFARRAGWRRVYVDLPGMGRSPAGDVASTDDVFRVLRAAVGELVPEGPYAVVGQSYGGYLARGLVAADAGRVAGLALVVTVVDPVHEHRTVPEHRVLVREPALADRLGGATLDAEEVLVVQTTETWDRARREADPGEADADAAAVERIAARYAGTFPVEPAAFECPALVVVGRQDSVTGYRDAWALLEHYPRATFAVLDRAGHALHLEQRGLFEALVGEWLDRVEEGADGGVGKREAR
ncbi:alpha/beta fold hydrolase [Promicromonospora citrea]|uniref:2-hydroxy-6-oxo-6-phenylhexa-2,4-dienoate hydrolase n=1 Tax=Promicromonospora citrea TaxID=43677 RepID=A0A8H9GF41_9MICO|nr:alpha/beta hydrolase [Promicromonospora citrea]NNH54523.1 alpha/beta hydrolase [Promicromonospora citrea]GGM12523.1 2-hydroxy-6-oxo-6-phenylhexa-2,4-dienoate hydrolase [Promicromonospora citrea]